GGVAAEDAIDVYPNPVPAQSVVFRPERVESLTSLRVDLPEMTRILIALGFMQGAPRGDNALTFIVPSWRIDVGIEEDLVEEVARHVGYDKIASELPPSNSAGEYQPTERKRRDLRRALTGLGFDEAIDFSFIDTAHDEQIELLPTLKVETGQAGEAPLVSLANPILDDAMRMRPTLLPGLLASVRHNLNHGNRNVRLFEIGRVFAGSEAGELPYERESLGLIAT